MYVEAQKKIVVPAQTASPGARLQKTVFCIILSCRDGMGETFASNLTGRISDELTKIQGCPTTEFKDNDLNCVVG